MAVTGDLLLQLGGAVLLVGYWVYETRRGRIAQMHRDVREAKQMGKVQSIIIRALALGDEKIDQGAVDEELAENGVTVDDFLSTRPDGGSREADPGDD